VHFGDDSCAPGAVEHAARALYAQAGLPLAYPGVLPGDGDEGSDTEAEAEVRGGARLR